MLGSAVYLVTWIDINIISSRKISDEPHIIIVIKQFKVIVPEAIYCFCHWSAKWSMGLCRYIANWGKRKGFSTIPFLCYYKKFKGNFFLFGYYNSCWWPHGMNTVFSESLSPPRRERTVRETWQNPAEGEEEGEGCKLQWTTIIIRWNSKFWSHFTLRKA